MSEGSGVEPMEAGRAEAEAWWRTGIIEMRPAGVPMNIDVPGNRPRHAWSDE